MYGNPVRDIIEFIKTVDSLINQLKKYTRMI